MRKNVSKNIICVGHPKVALEVVGACRRNSRNNYFSSCNWKIVTNTFVKVTDLHTSERSDWGASAPSLGKLLFTGSKQHRLSPIYQKRRENSMSFTQNSLTPFWGNKGNYKGDAVVKYMIRTQDEISFWQILVFRIRAAGAKEPCYVWYSASCSGKPTQSQ